jgi:hypothetical protein
MIINLHIKSLKSYFILNVDVYDPLKDLRKLQHKPCTKINIVWHKQVQHSKTKTCMANTMFI